MVVAGLAPAKNGNHYAMRYRKHIRLKNYDYKTDGFYFVTLCSAYKEPLLKKLGNILETELQNLPVRFPGLKIDYHKIMPSHLHVILILENSSKSLSEIVGAYKSITTLKTRVAVRSFQKSALQEGRLWQPNYYEHIIRSETSLSKIRHYVEDNPLAEKLQWDQVCKERSLT